MAQAPEIADVIEDAIIESTQEDADGDILHLNLQDEDLIKNEIYELAKNGATILFSTHRMEQVEEICQQIVLINQGKMLLHSDVKSAKKMFLKNEYIIEGDDLTNLNLGKTFELIEHQKESAILKINESYTYSQMLHELADFQIIFRTIRENLPSLNKIFIELVNQN
jgi:ABC-2 type transport system ATP-binding protein